MAEAPPHSDAPRGRRLVAIVLVIGVVASLLGRLAGHARYLHDRESLMIPTVGRELGHGHWADAIHYQYNLIQGGILVDGGLSALGFAAFGDSILAWKWYGLAYAAILAGLGMIVLKRTAGPAGAVLWPLLLIAAPFVLKDGLITPAGHHSSGFVWALGALAIALGGDAERPTWKRGLAAGVALGIAMFYMRTAISAGPAVAVALLRGGIRPVLAFGIGTLALPGLAAASASAFVASGSPYSEWGFKQTLTVLLYAPRAARLEVDHAAKLLEALSWSLRDLPFARAKLPRGGPEPMALMTVAGVVWSAALAWVPILLAGLAGLLVVRRSADGAHDRLWGTAVVLALTVAYVATYVLSPFRIDQFLLNPSDGPRFAPGSSGPRYVLPAWFALTVGMAHALGVGLGSPRLRYLALPAAAAVIGLGGASAIADVLHHREPDGTWATLRPFNYHKMFGPNRGPDIEVHAACDRGDPISRANHLRAMGWFLMPGLAELAQNPDAIERVIDDLKGFEPPVVLTPQERAFVLQGIGRGLGDELHSAQGLEMRRTLDTVFMVANRQADADAADALLVGFAEGFPQDRLTEVADEAFLELACLATAHGRVHPLCAQFGSAASDRPEDRLPDTPHSLFPDLPSKLIEGPYGRELLRGAGRTLALESPWLVDEVERSDREDRGLVLWPVGMATAFRKGWDEGTAKLFWTVGDPWIPALVP